MNLLVIKKKQNIQSLKKRSKLLTLFFLLTLLPAFCQSNPFLKSTKQNQGLSNKKTILIIFDASRSMEDKISGETKVHIAKRVLEEVLTKADSNVNIGLRVYGSGKPTGNPNFDCNDSRLVVFPNTNNRRLIISEIFKILPQGLTPITNSISQGVRDIIPYGGEKLIILISDGLETCGGDPCQLAQSLGRSKIDLKIDVVGFGVKDDWEAQQQLMCVALSTNGKYFSADSAEELTKGLFESINKSVTGRIITMINSPIEVMTTEIENYEHLPLLKPEKILLMNK